MMNATESSGWLFLHSCHAHCINHEECKTSGKNRTLSIQPLYRIDQCVDEVGHCQKCKNRNIANEFTNFSQPTIATKIKNILIIHLGNTALTQISIVMFCTILLVTGSLAVAMI